MCFTLLRVAMQRSWSLISCGGGIDKMHVVLRSRRPFSCFSLSRCRSTSSYHPSPLLPLISQSVKELRHYHQYRIMMAAILRSSTTLSGFPVARREAVVSYYRHGSFRTISGQIAGTTVNASSASSVDHLSSPTNTTTAKPRNLKRLMPEEAKAARRMAAKVKAMRARRKKVDKLRLETENLLEELSEAIQKLPLPEIPTPINQENAPMWPSKQLMDVLMKGLPASAAHRIVNALEKCATGKTYATPKSVLATVGRELKLMEKRAKRKGRTTYPSFISPLQRALQAFILSPGAKVDDLLVRTALEEAEMQEPMCAASSAEISRVLLELRSRWPHYAPSYRGGMSPIATTHETGLISSKSERKNAKTAADAPAPDASFGLGMCLLGGDEQEAMREGLRLSEQIRRQLPLVDINKLYSVLQKQEDKPSSHRVAFLWQLGSLMAPYTAGLLLDICKFLCVPIRPPRIRDIKTLGVIGWIEKIQTERQELVDKFARTLFLCRKRFILENQTLCGPYSLEALEEMSVPSGIAQLQGGDELHLLEMPVKKKKKKRANKIHEDSSACEDKIPLPFRKPNVTPKGNLSLVITPRHSTMGSSSSVAASSRPSPSRNSAAMNENVVSVDGDDAFAAATHGGARSVIPDSLLPTNDRERTVFLDNIPESATEQDIADVLSLCGRVQYARIICPSQSGFDMSHSEQVSKSNRNNNDGDDAVDEDKRHLMDPEECKEAVKEETDKLKREWILKKMPSSGRQNHSLSFPSSTPHAFVTFCDDSGYRAATNDSISILGIVIKGKCAMVNPATMKRTVHINTVGTRKSLRGLIHLLSEALKPIGCDVREMVYDTQNSGTPSALPATISVQTPSHKVALLVEKRLIEVGFRVSWKALKTSQRRKGWVGERANGKPFHVSPERMRIGSGLLDVLDIKAVDGTTIH